MRIALTEFQQQTGLTVLLLIRELIAADSIGLGVNLTGKQERKVL